MVREVPTDPNRRTIPGENNTPREVAITAKVERRRKQLGERSSTDDGGRREVAHRFRRTGREIYGKARYMPSRT